MVLTMEMGEDWDLGPTIPFYFAREKRYSRHKQSAEFVAIKRPLKKSLINRYRWKEFSGAARESPSRPGAAFESRARGASSLLWQKQLLRCFVRSFVVDMS